MDVPANVVEVIIAREGPRLAFPVPHPPSVRMWGRVPGVPAQVQVDTIDFVGPAFDADGGFPFATLTEQPGGMVVAVQRGS